MDNSCLSYQYQRTFPFLPSPVKPKGTHFSASKPSSNITTPTLYSPDRKTRNSVTSRSRGVSSSSSVVVVVAAAGASRCEPGSSLNAPLVPRSVAGKFLSSVLQNQRQFFNFAAADELKQLADAREAAVSRMVVSFGSDEACLHRRIAQLKELDSQAAVQDIMYMLIFYKFSEIRVPLVPRLSRCIYNGRLEIWPSKDWELQSIYGCEILEMIKEHVSTVIGLRANSSVTDNWATTEIQKLQLSQTYAASILYGYFLKSASLKHRLEQSLFSPENLRLSRTTTTTSSSSSSARHGLENFVVKRDNNHNNNNKNNNLQSRSFGNGSNREEKLRLYIMGFDSETLQRCAKLKSVEAVNLIEKHTCALFGDEMSGMLESDDEVIMTSFSSLKRLVLEGIAFGCFLWDTEEYVDTIYKLKENSSC